MNSKLGNIQSDSETLQSLSEIYEIIGAKTILVGDVNVTPRRDNVIGKLALQLESMTQMWKTRQKDLLLYVPGNHWSLPSASPVVGHNSPSRERKEILLFGTQVVLSKVFRHIQPFKKPSSDIKKCVLPSLSLHDIKTLFLAFVQITYEMAGPDTTLAAIQRHDKFYIIGGDLYFLVRVRLAKSVPAPTNSWTMEPDRKPRFSCASLLF